jgi:cell division protease FtsH
MIGSCGMGESLISIAAAGNGIFSGGLVEKVLADKAARAELDALLVSSRDDARAIITEHGQVVEALRDALMERDELVGHEITDVIAGCLSQTAGGSPVLERGPHRRRRTDVAVSPSLDAETPVS